MLLGGLQEGYLAHKNFCFICFKVLWIIDMAVNFRLTPTSTISHKPPSGSSSLQMTFAAPPRQGLSDSYSMHLEMT